MVARQPNRQWREGQASQAEKLSQAGMRRVCEKARKEPLSGVAATNLEETFARMVDQSNPPIPEFNDHLSSRQRRGCLRQLPAGWAAWHGSSMAENEKASLIKREGRKKGERREAARRQAKT